VEDLVVDEADIQTAFDDVFDQAIVFHGFADYMRDYDVSSMRPPTHAPESPHSTFGIGSSTAFVPRLCLPSRRRYGVSRSTTGSLTMTKVVTSTGTCGA
jgi:hypothetical protein